MTTKDRLPASLDATARREIREAQAAMAELIARIPRRFGYADEPSALAKAADHG